MFNVYYRVRSDKSVTYIDDVSALLSLLFCELLVVVMMMVEKLRLVLHKTAPKHVHKPQLTSSLLSPIRRTAQIASGTAHTSVEF